jgi:hypothetical protein
VAVNTLVVKSLKETYTRAQLVAARTQAAADILAGVQITQVTFEGGGASGRPLSGDPSYVLEHIQSAIDQLDDPDLSSQPSSAYFDLSKRPFGT